MLFNIKHDYVFVIDSDNKRLEGFLDRLGIDDPDYTKETIRGAVVIETHLTKSNYKYYCDYIESN